MFINGDHIIEVKTCGDQNREDVLETIERTIEAINTLKAQGRRLLILTDVERVRKNDMGARFAATQFVKLPFEKNAVYGGSPYVKYLGIFVIAAAGQAHRMRHLGTREKALEWLKAVP